MTFLAINLSAAEAIISDRKLQSAEFDLGGKLAGFVKGGVAGTQINPKIRLFTTPHGRLILGTEKTDDHLIVVDLSTAPIHESSDPEVVLIVQKLLRFAIKYWGAQRLSQTERLIANSTKAVVFPFPISNQTSYRLSIERHPDQRRMEKRNKSGHFLLVYKAGTTEGAGPQEQAEVTEFRKAIDALEEIRKTIAGEPAAQTASVDITQLKVTDLAEGQFEKPISEFQGFDRWLMLLTDKQKEYVQSPLIAPHRIEGPAGTGKTLCLILKCIFQLRAAHTAGNPYKALFLAHSDATRAAIESIFDANDEQSFRHKDDSSSLQTLKVRTLYQHCGEILKTKISDAEYLDRDAMNSKVMQSLYIEEAVGEAMQGDFQTHSRFMSDGFKIFLQETPKSTIADMIQHEISVVIKGRADESFDSYRTIPKLKYGLPLERESDKGFVWNIFTRYQAKLRSISQFDTDDVILSSIGQLNTPIWRRRRATEGFDGVFVDETHLFNMNELSVFHYLTCKESPYPIAYSVDRAQAVGDRGWGEAGVISLPVISESDEGDAVNIRTVFRSSPDIVNLACSVTSSGASLFTNFDNPLILSASGFTEAEEQKCEAPRYISFLTDDDLVTGAFLRAEELAKEMGVTKDNVAIIVFDEVLLQRLRRYASESNKPFELLERRGDLEVTERARKNGRFVLGYADYVGGLEFSGVVLVGADDGRLPPGETSTLDSRSYLNYASHNRLYVAITRAKYRVEILGERSRGISPLLKPAVESGILLLE
jgi:hypothetical protein